LDILWNTSKGVFQSGVLNCIYLFIFLSFKEEIILFLIEHISFYLESFYTLISISEIKWYIYSRTHDYEI
jgi:hypothetical protein